jgi:hypothetical protein
MIEYACRPDADLHKPVLHNPVASGHVIGEIEVEVDPYEQARAARWLRRRTPDGWRTLLDMLGLPEGGELTPWPVDGDREALVVCLAEVRIHEARLEPDEVEEPEDDEPGHMAPVEPTFRPDREWMSRAACRDMDVDVFFPHDTDEAGIAAAKRVCHGCPALSDCLDYAVETMQKHGVWGATTAKGRANVRRRRRARLAAVDAPTPEPVKAVREKLCNSCGVIQPASAFGKDVGKKTGLHHRCRDCVNEANRQRRREAKQAVAS